MGVGPTGADKYKHVFCFSFLLLTLYFFTLPWNRMERTKRTLKTEKYPTKERNEAGITQEAYPTKPCHRHVLW
jgi:hypothetical protein